MQHYLWTFPAREGPEASYQDKKSGYERLTGRAPTTQSDGQQIYQRQATALPPSGPAREGFGVAPMGSGTRKRPLRQNGSVRKGRRPCQP